MIAMARRRRDERGSSLVLVLATLTILSLMVPALLTLTGTGLLITRPIVEDRVAVYAATSALDAVMTNGRINLDIGTAGAPCPSRVLTVNGLEVTVDCENPPFPEDGHHTIDRFVTFTATVHRPNTTKVLASMSSEVVYRFDPAGPPRVEVRQFSSNPTEPETTTTTTPVTTTTTAPVTTTTTAPETTTTSTTTTVPATPVLVISSFEGQGVRVKPTSPSNWKAVVEASITTSDSTAVPGTQIQIAVEYLSTNKLLVPPTWNSQSPILATTGLDGVATFETGSLDNTGTKRIQGVRFTITGVTKVGHEWTGENENLLMIEVSPPS